ncbi:D-alanyl-D-alanine carboxypeptidase/D-alanyl-D-alanine endopeptidase [Cribrihabitans pelagius]|uniref:D-alanyl-D-alanine carboxypeptidase/D-alanyl-D-alanine endopeptidase n=1 Tax=Cribrihabitans pelagius TaxID=1765746 RepID=UPI003B5A433D
MISRRSFLSTGLAALAGTAAWGNAPAVSLRPMARHGALAPASEGGLEAVLRQANLPGQAACAVADVESGAVLEAEGGQTGLPPASVAKALTALYALDVLGGQHRFETRVLATAPLSGGVLDGDLVLAGGGDPMLDTDGLAELAAGLKAAGLRELRGRFLVWDGALPHVASIDPGQPDHLGYSPAVSGIALNFNRVHFEWRRAGSGWDITMDARTARYRPGVTAARMQVADRAGPVYTYKQANGLDHWTVADSALGRDGSRWLPVRNPGAYAGDVFRTLVQAEGIRLPPAEAAASLPQGEVLASRLSPPLEAMLKAMLKYSNNLIAEMIGMSASAARAGRPASLAASAAEMNRWAAARYGMANTVMVDHSGLGGQSRMTPQDLTGALAAAYREGQLLPLLKPYRLRDSKGRPVKSHPIKVAAKTGTLNFVSGLGGYITAPDGRVLAFAIFSADAAARAKIKRADRERPRGGRSWSRRARNLQQELIERWGAVYGS